MENSREKVLEEAVRFMGGYSEEEGSGLGIYVRDHLYMNCH